MSVQSLSSDSRTTEPDCQRILDQPWNRRKESFTPQIQKKLQENVYGQFDCEDYTITRGFIDGKGKGVRLQYTKLQPPKKVANVCIIHGEGEHSNNYLEIASYYANNGLVVHMLDLRGFGLSGGHKQHDTITELYHDIQTLLKRCEPSLPTFVVCNGLGSTLLMSLLTINTHLPINGIVIISPVFKLPRQCSSWTSMIVKRACRSLLGDLLVYNQINPSGLTKNNQALKKMIDQGCDFQHVKLKVAEQLEQATRAMLANAQRINYPVLIYSGVPNNNQGVYPVQKYFDSLGSKDKTFGCFPSGYHALIEDQECDNVKKQSAQWILQRTVRRCKVKMSPLRMPVNRTKRFSWKRVTGVVFLLLAILRGLRMLSKRVFL